MAEENKAGYQYTDEDSEVEIYKKIKELLRSEGKDLVVRHLLGLLNSKFQKRLLVDQNNHNKRMFIIQVVLVVVTIIALALTSIVSGVSLYYQRLQVEEIMDKQIEKILFSPKGQEEIYNKVLEKLKVENP